MRYTITGRNIEVTPGLKAAVEKKIGKLEHFFTPDTEVIVALSAQKDSSPIRIMKQCILHQIGNQNLCQRCKW